MWGWSRWMHGACACMQGQMQATVWLAGSQRLYVCLQACMFVGASSTILAGAMQLLF